MKKELSPITGKPMVIVSESAVTEFRGEKIQYIHLAYRCEDSGEQFTTDDLDAINENQVYNAYREKHGYPFPDEIIRLRHRYGVSASMMSDIMGFGANQWRYYEAGKVPNESNAKAIMAIRNESVFRDFLESSKQSIGERAYVRIKYRIMGEYARPDRPTVNNGYISYSPEKVAEVVKYFCSNLDGVFVTKMNKLLFYSDFLKYRRDGFGLTGLEYRAITYGPVPKGYGEVYSKAEGIDMEEYIYPNGTSGIVLRTDAIPNMDVFSETEKEILQDVCERFKDYSAGEISEQSHKEKGWQECSNSKGIIPYSYSFDIVE